MPENGEELGGAGGRPDHGEGPGEIFAEFGEGVFDGGRKQIKAGVEMIEHRAIAQLRRFRHGHRRKACGSLVKQDGGTRLEQSRASLLPSFCLGCHTLTLKREHSLCQQIFLHFDFTPRPRRRQLPARVGVTEFVGRRRS